MERVKHDGKPHGTLRRSCISSKYTGERNIRYIRLFYNTLNIFYEAVNWLVRGARHVLIT